MLYLVVLQRLANDVANTRRAAAETVKVADDCYLAWQRAKDARDRASDAYGAADVRLTWYAANHSFRTFCLACAEWHERPLPEMPPCEHATSADGAITIVPLVP